MERSMRPQRWQKYLIRGIEKSFKFLKDKKVLAFFENSDKSFREMPFRRRVAYIFSSAIPTICLVEVLHRSRGDPWTWDLQVQNASFLTEHGIRATQVKVRTAEWKKRHLALIADAQRESVRS
eukprot:TRINITY_DN21369_c0_g1_i1.p1 TRINITY_DN21369_c0_g1~~TRINITY_DN21369_c0_g1_i1.p1  ORF type:complete len:123 (+),score=15.10 TRINITY_DN21369_c0_g1_i1:26-394(+)